MQIDDIKDQVIKVLRNIQIDSELECPEITSKTKPVDDLPQFDSKVWSIATCLISSRLNMFIPNDVNIFCDEKTNTIFSIEQIAEKILKLSETDPIANLTSKP